MHVLFLILELTLLSAGTVGLLALVGFAPVALAVPNLGGAALLAAPLVGLGLLYWACQWLSPHFASGTIVVTMCVVLGIASALVGWRRRQRLFDTIRRTRLELALLGTTCLALFIVLELKVLQGGAFTITSIGGDDLYTWAPTATFMHTHAFSVGQSIGNQTLWILPTNIYPGSAGTVDGGFLSVFHMQGYQYVGPFTAICIVLSTCAVYGLLRSALSAPRWVATLGFFLICASESRSDIAILGFAQSARGTVLMLAAILFFVLALERRSVGMAVLAGGVAAVLPAVYMPVFPVVLAAVAGGGLVVAWRGFRSGWAAVPWRVLVSFGVAGIVFGLLNIWWLLFGGGLHAWDLQTSAAKIPSYQTFSEMVGTAPFLVAAHPFFWNGTWSAVGALAAWVAVALVIIGAWGMVTRQPLVAAMLGVPLLYGCVVCVAERHGFGAFMTVMYLLPVATIFAAYGVACAGRSPSLSDRRRPAAHRRRAFAEITRVAVAAFVALVVVFELAATTELTAFALQQSDLLPPTNLGLAALGSKVPVGSTILVYSINGATDAASYQKTLTLLDGITFLPGRTITLPGVPFTDRFSPREAVGVSGDLKDDDQFILHEEDPTIHDPAVPAGYHVIWTFPPDHLVLYRRSRN